MLFPPHEVAEQARPWLRGSAAVGDGGSRAFLYAGIQATALGAERAAREELAQHFRAESAVHRWPPAGQACEDPGVALPQAGAERQAGHQRLIAEETAGSRAIGKAQWQVHAAMATYREPVALAGRPRGGRRLVFRRWNFLVIPANSEDEARELAGQNSSGASAGPAVRAGHTPVPAPFTGM